MKDKMKNMLGYGALLTGALMIGGGIMAGAHSLYLGDISSAAENPKHKKIDESLIRYLEQLQISNNPRDIVAASVFLDFRESMLESDKPVNGMRVTQMKNAIAQSPNDADIAWIEAMGCGRLEAACHRKNAIARLISIEPDNFAAHMLAFDQAVEAGDEAQRIAELEAMANSRYSDIHYFSIGALYYDALRGWHSPIKLSASELFGEDIDQSPISDDESRRIVAVGYSLVVGLPPLQQLTELCLSNKLPPDELLACQKIATLLAKDKTLLMHRIGLRIGLAVFSEEPAANHWREAYRTSLWRISGHHPNRKKQYSERKYFNTWPSNDDEVAQQKQRLIDQGIPLSPPAGWMPENEDMKKLLMAPVAAKS